MNISILFEELLNENPNQAIKFLKEKNLDPATNPTGKKIFDDIVNITKGDGYTFLLLKFYLRDRIPLLDIEKLHEYLRENKLYLNNLPRPVVEYNSFIKLKRDIEYLQSERSSKRLYNQISPLLKQQLNQLPVQNKQTFKVLAQKFEQLPREKQRSFMKKVFGFKDINVLMDNMEEYMNLIESGNDYENIKNKIISTPDAHLIYANPDTEILIAHINSFDASKKLGCTSAWCITREFSRYIQYKAGGNYYFFIWDYKYPVNDPNFFIATAYSPSYPNNSRTHEHINDNLISFNDVIVSKDLNYNIFNDYIDKFKLERQKKYNSNSPIFKALQTNDHKSIVSIIKKSNVFKEYGEYDPHVPRYHGTVIVGINKRNMEEILDLGDGFDYIKEIATINYSQIYSADSDELNYMASVLSTDNLKLLSQLAKNVGINDEDELNELENEDGKLTSFLYEYDFDEINETYIEQYSLANGLSQQNEAKRLLDKLPLYFDNYDRTSFDIDTMVEYFIENNLNANNFDELIDEIKENIPYFGYDSINEAGFHNVDFDQLNKKIKEQVENILYDMENDEDNIYYDNIQMRKNGGEYLRKFGFEIYDKKGNFATLITNNIKIIVTDLNLIKDDEGDIIMANVTIYEQNDIEPTRKVKIPLTSIKNYIDQYNFKDNLKEEIKRIKTLL